MFCAICIAKKADDPKVVLKPAVTQIRGTQLCEPHAVEKLSRLDVRQHLGL